MTISTTEGGGAVAPYDEDYGSIGLEDVGAADLVMPRINIDHDKGVFVNSLTKEEFPALTAVFLGLIKQRVMWPDKLEDGDKPQCKSPDNTHGFPRVGDRVPRSKQFPWNESNFDPSHAVPVEEPDSAAFPGGWSSNGHNVLPCDACVFAKWGKDEDGKSIPPPCSEQHTYPILYMQEIVDEEGNSDTVWIPAIFTVQRSAIKNSRSYINGFAQSRQAMFTVYTGLTLTMESRGKNTYAVPNFKRMGPSDRNNWGEYANQLRGVRSFIRAAPRANDDGEAAPAAAPASNENAAPAAAAPAPAAPAPAPAAAPTPPPAAAAPPTPPAAAPAPPAPPTPPAPPAPPAAAAPPAPPAPPAAPAAPPAPPAAAPAAGGAPAGDDDLPF